MSSTSQQDTAAPSPPEPDLTPDELIARAIALRPKLIAAQAETEERTYYSEEMHQELVASGFYRLYIPRRYGGYEFDATTYMRVVIELSRGCVSTGWCAGLAAAHALQIASWFEDAAGTTTVAGVLTSVPFISNESPVAERVFAVALPIKTPVPFTLKVLLPRLSVVPRSIVPPVTSMAASVEFVDS